MKSYRVAFDARPVIQVWAENEEDAIDAVDTYIAGLTKYDSNSTPTIVDWYTIPTNINVEEQK